MGELVRRGELGVFDARSALLGTRMTTSSSIMKYERMLPAMMPIAEKITAASMPTMNACH